MFIDTHSCIYLYLYLEDKQPTKEEPPMRFYLFHCSFYFTVDVNVKLVTNLTHILTAVMWLEMI
jgi:hypothetical protein